MAATTGTFRLGPGNGRIVLKTSRAGFAAKAGHDLTIEVTRWSAQVEVPDEDAGGVAAAKVTRFGASGGAIEGTVTLNGQSQPARLQVSEPAPGRYRGSATVPQTGFGIKPYTGFFGALKLKDEVTVEFEVNLSEAEAAG